MCVFEIVKALTNYSQGIYLCNKNFASVICNLLSFSANTFRFEVFSAKNSTSQVSVDGLKCPLSILERCPSYRELNYSKLTQKRPVPT